MERQQDYSPGLEGVIAGRTGICKVDSENSQLLYRGYSAEDLARDSNFEEVAYLLIKGSMPKKGEMADWTKVLWKERQIPKNLLKMFSKFPSGASPMDMVRSGVSFIALFDPDVEDNSHEANVRKAIRLTATLPIIIAASFRISNGKKPIEPELEYSHSRNFLYMISGTVPNDFVEKAFDVSLILYAEHDYNASTFTTRVTASTLADIHSAVISGICALKGSLHGGANEKAMEMLLAIGEEDRVEEWVREALLRKERIMGFGHRVYKKGDPRALIMKRFCKQLGEKNGTPKWYRMSLKTEEIMEKEKGLYPNIDFYAGSAYYMMGIPIELYTPIFTLSRITGWSAHIIEQHDNNRLIRPMSEYTGPERQRYVPIDERG